MRIVGGKFKSIRFKPPKAFTSRPTTDFAKEGLFNTLSHRMELEEISVLDLFCGTGNISFEFLSRGASVVSVDQNFKCLKFMEQVTKKLKALNQLKLVRSDVQKYIIGCENAFDVVFMDPPFDQVNYDELIVLVYKHQIVKPEGLLIVEHHKKVDLSDLSNYEQTKKYGSVCFSFFTNKK